MNELTKLAARVVAAREEVATCVANYGRTSARVADARAEVRRREKALLDAALAVGLAAEPKKRKERKGGRP